MTAETKLDPQVKTDWLAALRSGDYKQGRGFLMNKDGSCCCLGVLCEIQKVPRKQSSVGHYSFYFGEKADYANPTFPSTDFRKMVGLTEDQASYLVNMNDKDKKTFKQIADHIEKNF